MTIRKILIPLLGRADGAELKKVSETSLRNGFQLGRRLAAHVEVCCLAAAWHDPDKALSAGIPGTAIEVVLREIEKKNEECFWKARSLFDEVAEEFLPQRSDAPSGAPGFSARFMEISGEVGGAACDRGKLADLIVITDSTEGHLGTYDELLHAVLTETGRPVLVVPPDWPEVGTDKIAIAWNGSSEAARALALALDLVRAASEVTVLCVQEDDVPSAQPEELAGYLGWHGVEANVVTAEGAPHQVGDILQDLAGKAGAELLVMGAYTRGRLRRLVFGGATGAALANPKMPLFMVD